MGGRSQDFNERKRLGGDGDMARVALRDMPEISLDPETTDRDVQQCLSMIFGTPKGSVPYMRGLGIEPSLIDKRLTPDINEVVDESYEQTEKYEPRISLEDVEQEADAITGEADIFLTYEVINEDEEDEEEEYYG